MKKLLLTAILISTVAMATENVFGAPASAESGNLNRQNVYPDRQRGRKQEHATKTYCVDPDDVGDPLLCDVVMTSVAEINALTSVDLQGGDSVLFERGNVWREQLTISVSGDPGSPVLFGAYGPDRDVNGNTIPNPLIMRTEPFNAWWLASIIGNGGMEQFTERSPSDDFAMLSELIGANNCPAVADDTESHRGIYSVKMVCDQDWTPFSAGSRANIFATVNDVNGGSNYYLSAWSKSNDPSHPLIIRIKYTTDTQKLYLNSSNEWVPAGRHLTPWAGMGSGSWVEQTLQFTIPGSETGSLQVGFYQWSDDAVWLDDVYLVEGVGPSAEKVWAGTIQDTRKYYGAVADTGERLSVDSVTSHYDPQQMTLGYFSKKVNSGIFYLRNDSDQTPGELEVGVRKHAIFIDGESNIEIENIDIWGPGGRQETGFDSGARTDSFDIKGGASDITVRNMELSHSHTVGIHADESTANIHYENIDAHDNASTGIYLNGLGGSVENSKSYYNGLIESDTGDSGGIGCYRCGDVEISGNEVYSNGRTETDADFEISIVTARGPVTISHNYIHNCVQGCVQLAASPDSRIFNNIIAGFGTTTFIESDYEITHGKWGGIRVGHRPGSQNVQIYNNVITGGQMPATTDHAAITIYTGNNSGTIVRNNIIYGNKSRSIFVLADNRNTENNDLTFYNNRYDEVIGDAKWYWKGQYFEYLVNWKSMVDQNNLIGDKSRLLNRSFIDFPNSATLEGDYPAWWPSIRRDRH